jgi:hypothetical protein
MPNPIRRLLGIIYYVCGFLTVVSFGPLTCSGGNVSDLISHDRNWVTYFIFVGMFVTVQFFTFLFTGKIITPNMVNSYCFKLEPKE